MEDAENGNDDQLVYRMQSSPTHVQYKYMYDFCAMVKDTVESNLIF